MMGKTYKFCPLCGGGLVERFVELEGKTRRVCDTCDFIYYQNPTPAAGVVVLDGERVLLVKRKYEPRAGLWTLPAGFVEAGEDAGECAARETKEETNLDVEIVRVFNVYSAFDDPRTAVVLIMYLARRIAGDVKPGDDASEAGFYALDEMPGDIAFRAHRNALADIKQQLGEGLLP